MAVTTLDREMFQEAEAARLLRVPRSTLHWWLEGGTRRTKVYRPVIRIEPTGSTVVTWGEFVEAALLRQYRRAHNVPLVELRSFIDLLRHRFDVPYPLAHCRPFVGVGRRLLLEVQERAGLDAEFCLVAVAAGQPVLTLPAETYFERVQWDDELAVGWRPHDDPRSPVTMNPDVRFGLPAIRGIRTEVLWEQIEAGEDADDLAVAFDLSPEEVRWAYAYEATNRPAA